MIIPSPYNRQILKDYLDDASEDDFIDNFIYPLFYKSGYISYRTNAHGPGEHGKDLIFYRDVPVFYDHEFVAVQAKAERAVASNVAKFSEQLLRALRVPFPMKSGGARLPNYVMFINSKTHSNDADFEFPSLVENKNNIKILSQENIIDLMIRLDIIPTIIKDKLDKYDAVSQSFDDSVREIILSGDNAKINNFLDKQLKIESRPITTEIQALVINYIFDKWDENPGWDGTVRPMKWLDLYFHFIQPNQFDKLLSVFEEYTSPRPSYEARSHTASVVSKISSEQIDAFENEFIKIVVRKAKELDLEKFPHLKTKYQDFIKSPFVDETTLEIVSLINKFNKQKEKLRKEEDQDKKQALRPDFLKTQEKLYYVLYPEEKEEND